MLGGRKRIIFLSSDPVDSQMTALEQLGGGEGGLFSLSFIHEIRAQIELITEQKGLGYSHA